MEFLLAVILPIAILAGCLVVIRIVRDRQRRGALGNAAPDLPGESTIPGHEPTPVASAERGGEQVDSDHPLEPDSSAAGR